jgi:hypothetical protein
MAKIEIDENALVAKDTIVRLVDDIQRNPKTREQFLRAVKEVRPDMPVPEIDAAAPIHAAIAELKKQQEEFISEQRKRAAEEDSNKQTNEFVAGWNKQKNSLAEQGYYPDAIAKIEEFAKTEGIPNLLAAAAYYEKRNPPSLTAPRAGAFSFDEASDDGKLINRLMESKMQRGQIDRNAVMQLAENALRDVRASNKRSF